MRWTRDDELADIKRDMARIEGSIQGAVVATATQRDHLAFRLDEFGRKFVDLERAVKELKEKPAPDQGPPKDGRYWRWSNNAWLAIEKPPVPMPRNIPAALAEGERRRQKIMED